MIKISLYIGLCLLLAILAFALVREWQHLFPPYQTIDSTCDLNRQDCSTMLPDAGQVRLRIQPKPIALMQPLSIEIAVHNTTLQPAYLDITGVNMPMGLNRVPLVELHTQTWQGQAILPVCSQREMVWQIQLVLVGADTSYQLRYQFTTHQ